MYIAAIPKASIPASQRRRVAAGLVGIPDQAGEDARRVQDEELIGPDLDGRDHVRGGGQEQ